MEPLLKAVDRFTTFTGRAVGQFYFILAVITMYEVVTRYFLEISNMWVFELVMLLCGVAWLLSAGYVTQQKGHIAITILYVVLPRRAQWFLDLFSNTVGLVVILILAYASWPMMRDALTMHELSGTAFNSPEPMIAKSVLVIGSLMYALQLLVNLIRHLRDYGNWR